MVTAHVEQPAQQRALLHVSLIWELFMPSLTDPPSPAFYHHGPPPHGVNSGHGAIKSFDPDTNYSEVAPAPF